jgi:hypothetical protein
MADSQTSGGTRSWSAIEAGAAFLDDKLDHERGTLDTNQSENSSV